LIRLPKPRAPFIGRRKTASRRQRTPMREHPSDRDRGLSHERRDAQKVAQMANYANTRMTQLHDWRRKEFTLDEMERIRV